MLEQFECQFKNVKVILVRKQELQRSELKCNYNSIYAAQVFV